MAIRGITSYIKNFGLLTIAAWIIFTGSPACATETVTLQLKWLHQFQFAGYYAAKEKGYYRDAGLEVNLLDKKPDKSAIDTVVEGKAEYGVDVTRLLLERAEGKPVVALAVIFQHSPYILVARQDSSTQNIHDLVGKRLMLEETADDVSAYLKKEGLTSDRYFLVKHTFKPQDLIDGSVDAISAYSTNELFYLDNADFRYQAYTPRSAGIDFYGDTLFTTEQELKNHPDRVKAFREATLRGWKYAMAHPEEIADLIIAQYSQRKSREHLLFEARQMVDLIQPELIELGYMNPGRWQHIADTYADLGMLPRDFSFEGFLYDPNPKHDYSFIKNLAFILGACLVGVTVFVFVLRRQVRRKTQAIVEAAEQYQTILQSAPDGFWRVGRDGRLVDVNDRYVHLSGYSREELIGMPLEQIEQIEKKEEIQKRIEALTESGFICFESRHKRKDGTVWDVEVSSSYLPSKNEMITFLRDITERKHAADALFEKEKQFRLLAENSTDIISRHSTDGTYLYVSPACRSILGYEPDELIGHSAFEFIHPDDIARIDSSRRQVIETPAIDYVSFRIRHKDGSYVWVDSNSHSISDKKNDALEIQVSSRDITERKRAEEEKAKLVTQLQQAQKMEAIGTLAGGIAHDFNNILGAILGYSEMVQEDCPPGSRIRSDIDKVVEASHRAKELVKQILAFSRQTEIEVKPLQPAFVIKEALKMLRASLPTTIAIQQNIDPEVRQILADPTQIHQILTNLCTNAFQAMEEAGGTLTISLKNKELVSADLIHEPHVQPGHFVEISVGDTGPGIAPEIMDKIFDPFFTTKEVGKGTGMGLAIIHGIAKKSGGFVSCKSSPVEGATFYVYLPVHAVTSPPAAETTSFELIETGIECILFIDDEEILAEMGKTMLERLGYRVTVETNSIEALKIIQNQPDHFDLVITDQTMPGMTGSDLARRILQTRPGLPIILCTGFSNQISEEKARIYGIKGFAMKPLAKKDLATIIRKVLDEGKGSA